MAVKGGSIVHVGNGLYLLDRIQNAGPGQVSINTEKINELGNYKSVATVRDTPDLQFSIESLDVSTELEEFVTGGVQDVGDGLDMGLMRPVDLATQFKAGQDAVSPFAVVKSIVSPFLYCESFSWRYGLRDNASKSATLRGDSIFYNPGPAFIQVADGTNTANQTVVTAHPAYQLGEGDARRVLSVTAGSRRLTFGADYTEAAGTVTAGAAIVTLTILDPVPATDEIRIAYASPDAVSVLQNAHPDPTVKPAAVKGRDIEIYLGGYDPADIPGSQANRFLTVQSINADWRATLSRDEEMGNAYATGVDFETPAVSGAVEILPRDANELYTFVRKIAGQADATKIVGTAAADPLELDIRVKHPDTGATVERLHIPDARFTVPGVNGRANQKTPVSLQWESDEGTILVFDE